MKQGPTVIIGGGITGLCTAYYLVKRDQPVVVISRDPFGDGASSGNAGILAAGHLPLPRPGLAVKALRWMLDRQSPLYIPPRLDPALIRWFWNFHRACNQRQISHCMDILAPLGRRALECWQDILAAGDFACDFRSRGWLEVYRTRAGCREATAEGDQVQDLGFEVVNLSGPELRAREPAFGPEVAGAVHYCDSASLDPLAFMTGLPAWLEERGVVFRSGEEVSELMVSRDRCVGVRLATGDEVRGADTVLAAGIWSAGLAKAAGLNLPMQAGKGYHLDLEPPSPPLETPAVLMERAIAVTPMADRLRLAGTVEFSGVNRNLVASRVRMLSAGASEYLSGISGARGLTEGCDLRPCTADGLPVLGWAPHLQGLLISTGGAKMGMTLGPALGQLAAELLLEGRTSLDVTSLQADRF
jgi:D-amino-acid dehydrogenase